MSKIVIDSKLAKRIVKLMFYGRSFISHFHMNNRTSARNTFDQFIEILEAEGWEYTCNGEIRKRR